MQPFNITKFALLSINLITFALVSCAPEITETTTESPNSEIAPTPENTAPQTDTTPQPTAAAPLTPDDISEEFTITNYSNENWAIAVVEADKTLTYYGCDTANDNCITLTEGTQSCQGDVCTVTWTTANNTLKYQLMLSEMGKKIVVTEGEKIILDADGLQQIDPAQDLIPEEQEIVAGISEATLQTLLPTIQEAVHEKDWQAIAAMGTDPLTVSYPEEGRSSQIAISDLGNLLDATDIDQWRARIMTKHLGSLLLNQYGVMLGGGSLWLSETDDNASPKIYAINIW